MVAHNMNNIGVATPWGTGTGGHVAVGAPMGTYPYGYMHVHTHTHIHACINVNEQYCSPHLKA
jgi:hypothetical protein